MSCYENFCIPQYENNRLKRTLHDWRRRNRIPWTRWWGRKDGWIATWRSNSENEILTTIVMCGKKGHGTKRRVTRKNLQDRINKPKNGGRICSYIDLVDITGHALGS